VCPGALLPKKRWPLEGFIDVMDYVFKQYGMTCTLVGDANDALSLPMQHAIQQRQYIHNMIARSNLFETAEMIKTASLVITNDTSISHMGVAANKPVIIISNGEHYGRFSEYPKEIHDRVFYAYPAYITGSQKSFHELVEEFHNGSQLNIKTISSETVKRLVDKAFAL
jgi:ADP-heptose:LPS heptosyltransferase